MSVVATETNPAAVTTDTPAPTAVDRAVVEGDQAAFREARRAEREGKPLTVEPAAKASPAVTTPEQEADSDKPDADLSDAGRTLRMNRSDKRAARVRQENDDLARELQRRQQLRRDLEAESRPRHPERPAVEGRPSTGTTTLDRNDPEPKEEAYANYGEYVRDQARWAAREEFRQQQVANRARVARDSQARHVGQIASRLEETEVAMRGKYADFDAVTAEFIGAVPQHEPARRAVAEFLAESEVGGEISYRIGKDAKLREAVSHARSIGGLYRVLAKVEDAITAAKASAKPVTSAPPPPTVLGTKASEPADELEAVIASGDQARYKALRLRQRTSGLR